MYWQLSYFCPRTARLPNARPRCPIHAKLTVHCGRIIGSHTLDQCDLLCRSRTHLVGVGSHLLVGNALNQHQVFVSGRLYMERVHGGLSQAETWLEMLLTLSLDLNALLSLTFPPKYVPSASAPAGPISRAPAPVPTSRQRVSVAAGLARLWLSRQPSLYLAEPSHLFGYGFLNTGWFVSQLKTGWSRLHITAESAD